MKPLPQFETDKKYIKARKHVEDLKGFYSNLLTYCLVIPFLIVINYKTYWNFKWFWFPVFGWGIGLSLHAYHVFINNSLLGRKWEERKIQEYIKKEEEKRWN